MNVYGAAGKWSLPFLGAGAQKARDVPATQTHGATGKEYLT